MYYAEVTEVDVTELEECFLVDFAYEILSFQICSVTYNLKQEA